MFRVVGLFIALAWCAAAAQANPVIDSVTILEHGTFKAQLVDRVARPSDPSGFANTLTGHQLIERTEQICARLGVRFGVTIRLEGKPADAPVMLEIVNNYPPQGIVNDKGQTFHKTRFPWRATIGQPTTIVFTFDETWEMAHGPWTYDIEFNGTKIGGRTFTVMTTCETS
jgi:Domain of unknown function (DUF3859)